jgi:hypothetical protein
LEAGCRLWFGQHSASAFLFLSLLGGTLAAPASAQHPAFSIDGGALSMQYADSIDANAIAVTPSLWIDSRRASLAAVATLSEFSGGGWSAQGSADGSLFTPGRGLLLGEFGATAGGSTRNDASRTGQILGIARAHFSTDTRGVWVGAGLGGTWDGVEWRNVRQGEAAAWIKSSNAGASLSATPIVVDDSIRYTDVQVAGALSFSRVDLDASAGFRGGSRLPTLGGTAKSWGSATVTGWLTSRIALVASAGTYPVDLTQGFPGGRFVSLSIRFGSRRFSPVEEPKLEPLSKNAFALRNVTGDLRELRIRAPGAARVEIMGDFSDWKAVGLQPEGNGWWSARLPIKHGIHELNMRIDGGSWTVPAGLPKKSDEFGGSIGVLVVEM